jgi:hypothetical protein
MNTTNVLTKIAAQLGTTVKFLWQTELKQAQVSIMQDSIMIALFLAIIVVCILAIRYCKRTINNNEGYDDIGYWFGAWVAGIVGTISLALMFGEIMDLVNIIMNPAGWVLNLIISQIRGM